MSGYSSAWFDASQLNIAAAAAAAAAASNSRSHQLYASVADDDCLRPAAPVASCRPLSQTTHHAHSYDIKQLQHTPFIGVTHVQPADMSAYSDDRYSMCTSYCAYSSCHDCSSDQQSAPLTVHARLVLDTSSDIERNGSDIEQTQQIDSITDVSRQQLNNNEIGQNSTRQQCYCTNNNVHGPRGLNDMMSLQLHFLDRISWPLHFEYLASKTYRFCVTLTYSSSWRP